MLIFLVILYSMNILVLQTTQSGVYYHRQYVPHFRWTESGDEFENDFVAIFEVEHFDKIMHFVNQTHFDIVVYSIAMNLPPNMPHFIDFMKRRGTKFVLDIDDLYRRRSDVNKALKHADAVTTPSPYLANHYFKYGAKRYPHVIENGIDTEERQFQPYAVENSEVVFGYLGSTRHEDDLREMKYNFSSHKMFVVCEEYFKVLKVDAYSTLKHWTEYAWEYNNIDVAVAPLVPNPFNLSKSALKIFEAGFKKKAIICSDVGPYANVKKEFESCVDFIPTGDSWRPTIESYTLEEAKQRGEELYKLVQPYEIKTLNKKRRAIYEDIIGDSVYTPIKLSNNNEVKKTGGGSNYTPPKKRNKKKRRK